MLVIRAGPPLEGAGAEGTWHCTGSMRASPVQEAAGPWHQWRGGLGL